ncbi:DUF4442 domain-containing protein [Salinisphaera orenii]|uniref:DUF4442 domain-containing protein n=1 Tax=Salinisphaera orenii TaxID=856731 RepID=UPI000F490619
MDLRTPDFVAIAPRFVDVAPEGVIASMRKGRRRHKSIRTVHAIALCNPAEAAAGVLAQGAIPASHRRIPNGTNLDGRARAGSGPTATPGAADRGVDGNLRLALERGDDRRSGGVGVQAPLAVQMSPRHRRDRRHSTRVTVCPLARSRSTRPRGPTR